MAGKSWHEEWFIGDGSTASEQKYAQEKTHMLRQLARQWHMSPERAEKLKRLFTQITATGQFVSAGEATHMHTDEASALVILPCAPPMPARPAKTSTAHVRAWEQVKAWRLTYPHKYIDGPQYLEAPLMIHETVEDPFYSLLRAQGAAINGAGYALNLAFFAVQVLRAPWPDAEPRIALSDEAIEAYSKVFDL